MNAQTFEFRSAGTAGVSLMDHFADVLAETGSIEEAARAVRVTVDVGRALFERICRALGPQAE